MNEKIVLIFVFSILILSSYGLAQATCGDGIIDTGEQCDGTDLGTPAATCVSLGYESGTLGCYPPTDPFECKFDVTNCVGAATSFVSVQDGVLDAKDLFVSGNVGIGTSNPLAKLHLVGVAGLPMILVQATKAPTGFQTLGISSGVNGDFFISRFDDVGNNPIRTDLTIMAESGNVGIGTTTPQGKLDVVGDVNITGNIYVGGENFGTNGGSGGFWNATETAGDIYYNDGKIGVGTNTPGALVDVFGGNIALRGPSGITPRLIFGESVVDSFTPFEFVSFSRPSPSLDTCSGDIDTQYRCDPIETRSCVDLTNSTVVTQTAYYNRTVKCVLDTNTYSINNNGGTLAFIDNNGNNNLVVKQGGNVGIGTSDPRAKLNVVGDVNITGNAYINGQPLGAGGGVWLASSTPGNIYYNGGNVGIGNNKPLEKLDVSGNVRISGSGEATTIQVGFDVPEVTSVVESGAGNLNSGRVYYKVSAVYSSGESLLSSEEYTDIVDNKKVTITWTRIEHAIGYNVYGRGPTSYLKVNSDLIPNPGSGDTVFIDDSGGSPLGPPIIPTIPSGGLATAGGMIIGGNLEVKGSIIGSGSSGGVGGWTADTSVPGSEKTTTDYNVGIGTSTPGAKLDVVTGDTTDSAVHIGELLTSGGYITSASPSQFILSGGLEFSGEQWVARTPSLSAVSLDAGSVTFVTGSGFTVGNSLEPTEYIRMAILDDGNVGIGTTTPQGKLNVESIDTDEVLRLSRIGGNYAFQSFWHNGVRAGYILGDDGVTDPGSGSVGNKEFLVAQDVNNANWLRLGPLNTIGIVVDNSGNVGIGTNNPNKMLQINGSDLLPYSPGESKIGIELINTANTGLPSRQVDIGFRGSHPSSEGRYAAITGVITGSSGNGQRGDIVFSTKFNGLVGDTSLTERMRIDFVGRVSINDLVGSGNAYVCVDSTGRLYRSSTACA